jgi:hypothetical protein
MGRQRRRVARRKGGSGHGASLSEVARSGDAGRPQRWLPLTQGSTGHAFSMRDLCCFSGRTTFLERASRARDGGRRRAVLSDRPR